MNLSPLWLSLQTATIATAFVFIIGVILARFMSRRTFWGKSIIEAIILLPLILPPTVVGFSLLYLFGKNGFLGKLLMNVFDFQIVFTGYAVIMAAIIVSFPLMYQSSTAAFQKFDENIENAAQTMGASKWRVFWTISFPLAWPGLLAGLVLSFARALGEFGATLMVAGYIPDVTNTMPLTIYFAVESGDIGMAKFWVTIIIVLGFIAILWLNWWHKRHITKHTATKQY